MADTTRYRLKLYVTGGTDAAEKAIAVLGRLCRQCAGRIQSEVIDVLIRPDLLLDTGLEPLPMFVRTAPEPVVIYRTMTEDAQELARCLHIE